MDEKEIDNLYEEYCCPIIFGKVDQKNFCSRFKNI